MEAARTARVIVVCASPSAVRELMIHAHDLHLDNGDYVFINLDLLNDHVTSHLWYNDTDSEERNDKAVKAYESLLTVTARKPASAEFHQFSSNVKEHYEDKEEEVNSFVTSFADAVILYALALNETLEAGRDVINGDVITSRMWNRTFQGVAGPVSIDENGDRSADYSLWDLNPGTRMFEVVGNYHGNRQRFEPVPGRAVHWAGAEPTPHLTNPCGLDLPHCPAGARDFPDFVIILLVLGSLLLIALIVTFIVINRRRAAKH